MRRGDRKTDRAVVERIYRAIWDHREEGITQSDLREECGDDGAVIGSGRVRNVLFGALCRARILAIQEGRAVKFYPGPRWKHLPEEDNMLETTKEPIECGTPNLPVFKRYCLRQVEEKYCGLDEGHDGDCQPNVSEAGMKVFRRVQERQK